MNYIFALFLCLTISLATKAQTTTIGPELVLAKVAYKFTHINDTNNSAVFINDETVTYLAKNTTYYTTYNKRLDEQLSQQVNSENFDGNLTLLKSTTPINQDIYLNIPQRELKTLHKLFKNEFLVEEPFPAHNWIISKETKTIGGYNCQKAETSFKGRNYTAWFTSEIPFPYGPWKLHGLPGLILEAYDNKKEVIFEYDGFDTIEDQQITIGIPEGTRIDKLEEVQKLQKANTTFNSLQSEAKPIKIQILSGMQKSSFNTISPDRIKSISINNAPGYSKPKETNNPIELIN